MDKAPLTFGKAKAPAQPAPLTGLAAATAKLKAARQTAQASHASDIQAGIQAVTKPNPRLALKPIADPLATIANAQLEIATPQVAPQAAPNATIYDHPSQPDSVDDTATANFSANLATLTDSINTPEVSANLANTLQDLEDNPQFKSILLPTDIASLVRALRASYGVVIKKKVANKTKRSKSAQVVDSIMDDLADIQL